MLTFGFLGHITVHCSTAYFDATYCCRCSVVCRSVTIVSPAKMAEPIKMLFGLWTRVGHTNHVLDGVQIPRVNGAILKGKGVPL